MIAALLTLSAALARADDAPIISQDITVKSKAAGPALAVPAPAAAPAVVDEVLDSLSLGRGDAPQAPVTRVSVDESRLAGEFPPPPFLDFSPARVAARYDAWTFEVLDGERAVWRREGSGPARERLSWDGAGRDGRLAAAAGRAYRYRFTGRRGGGSFVVESDPVTLRSFSRREYLGDTRLEVAASELFDDGARLSSRAGRYLRAIAARLEADGASGGDAPRFVLRSPRPRSPLAQARARALAAALAAALKSSSPPSVEVASDPRGADAFDAFLPVPRGPTLRNK